MMLVKPIIQDKPKLYSAINQHILSVHCTVYEYINILPHSSLRICFQMIS